MGTSVLYVYVVSALKTAIACCEDVIEVGRNMTSAASPLTELLRSTKPARNQLLQQRDYEGVKSLRESCFQEADSIKLGLQRDVRARHDTERRRLAHAREAALLQVHDKVQHELGDIENQWNDRRAGFDARQQQRFDQLERTARLREEAKPIVLSSYVRDLQQSEAKLARLHQYGEAAQVRRKIQHLEVQERGVAEIAKEDRVQRALDNKRRAMGQDDSNFRAKVKNELQLAMSRARREEERVKSKFDHIERDMRHAHSLELRKNPLQAPYERPAFIKPRQMESEAVVSAASMDNAMSASAASRGTEYLRRTQGSKLHVTSLCDLYRDGVPDTLRRSGETLRLGSDPTSPQRLDSRGVIDLSLPAVK
jgi:hypothetical protein